MSIDEVKKQALPLSDGSSATNRFWHERGIEHGYEAAKSATGSVVTERRWHQIKVEIANRIFNDVYDPSPDYAGRQAVIAVEILKKHFPYLSEAAKQAPVSEGEAIPLYECNTCKHIYQEKVSECDCTVGQKPSYNLLFAYRTQQSPAIKDQQSVRYYFNCLSGYLSALDAGRPISQDYLKRLRKHYLPALEQAIAGSPKRESVGVHFCTISQGEPCPICMPKTHIEGEKA